MQTSIILTCSSCHEKLNFFIKTIDNNVVLRVYKCESCKKSGICSVCGEGVVYKKGVCQDCYEYEQERLLTPRAADDCPRGGSHVYKWDGTLPTDEMIECEKCGHRR